MQTDNSEEQQEEKKTFRQRHPIQWMLQLPFVLPFNLFLWLMSPSKKKYDPDRPPSFVARLAQGVFITVIAVTPFVIVFGIALWVLVAAERASETTDRYDRALDSYCAKYQINYPDRSRQDCEDSYREATRP